MSTALNLAQGSIGVSDPNPRVGCVIGSEAGEIFGMGCTQAAGSAHAEVMALRDAQSAGHSVRGATAWVSLEPCAHHGRTPPCCDALIAAGLARVVAATEDPNPQVGGKGLERLRAAGLQVELADGELRSQARELNIGFFSRHERGRPWVRLKLAVSMDGQTALRNGTSQWITGPEARADGHLWRKRASAVVTGIGTVLADDPRMDVRLVETSLQPLRVIVDSSLRLPLDSRILAPPGRVLVATVSAQPARQQALQGMGAEVQACAGKDGRVDLHGLIRLLGERGANEIHVEAGAVLSGAMVARGLVDEVLMYVAPVLLGPGRGAVDWAALETLSSAPRLSFVDTERVGADLRIRSRFPSV